MPQCARIAQGSQRCTPCGRPHSHTLLRHLRTLSCHHQSHTCATCALQAAADGGRHRARVCHQRACAVRDHRPAAAAAQAQPQRARAHRLKHEPGPRGWPCGPAVREWRLQRSQIIQPQQGVWLACCAVETASKRCLAGACEWSAVRVDARMPQRAASDCEARVAAAKLARCNSSGSRYCLCRHCVMRHDHQHGSMALLVCADWRALPLAPLPSPTLRSLPLLVCRRSCATRC